MHPCDGPDGFCPFDAVGGYDCRNFCGLGVDEDEEKDMPAHVLDISNATNSSYKDAVKYRAIEAERKAKEEHQQAMNKLAEKIVKHKLDIDDMQKKLEEEMSMLKAMESEYKV